MIFFYFYLLVFCFKRALKSQFVQRTQVRLNKRLMRCYKRTTDLYNNATFGYIDAFTPIRCCENQFYHLYIFTRAIQLLHFTHHFSYFIILYDSQIRNILYYHCYYYIKAIIEYRNRKCLYYLHSPSSTLLLKTLLLELTNNFGVLSSTDPVI